MPAKKLNNFKSKKRSKKEGKALCLCKAFEKTHHTIPNPNATLSAKTTLTGTFSGPIVHSTTIVPEPLRKTLHERKTNWTVVCLTPSTRTTISGTPSGSKVEITIESIADTLRELFQDNGQTDGQPAFAAPEYLWDKAQAILEEYEESHLASIHRGAKCSSWTSASGASSGLKVRFSYECADCLGRV